MTDGLHEVTEQGFDAEVLRAAVPVLVDFTAAWCGPCRALAPVLRSIAAENGARLKVVAVDGDVYPGLAARYGIRGFPTVVMFVGGVETGRQLGLASRARLLALLGDGLARAAG